MGPIRNFPGVSADTADVDSSKTNGKKIADAAGQFEALMIGQILKAAHGSESAGWLGAGEDDDSSSTAIQMAEEYLGQAIAKGGGLGIAKMVIKGIDKSASKPANSALIPGNSNPSRTDSPLPD
jgi:Rod binding domain-containing protein